MRLFPVALLALIACPVSAQMVYKCVAKDGHVTLTSEPCSVGQKESSAIYAPPERMTRARYDELQRRRQQDEANSLYLESLARGNGRAGGGYTQLSSTNAKHAQCQSARARRDSARKAMGMKANYLSIRRLDEMVYDACK